jgi:hypothetical protein
MLLPAHPCRCRRTRGIFRAFVIDDGLIEEQEGAPTFEEMVTMFSNARPRLTLVKG